MNCIKCGREISDNAAFCVYCGSKQDPSSAKADTAFGYEVSTAVQTEKVTASQPPKKRNLKAICIAGAVVVLLVLCFAAYNRPAAKMNRALKADDLELAWEIYDESLYGEELSDKSLELLKAAAERLKESYAAETISYEDALAAVDYIDYFDNDAADEIASEAYDAIRTQYTIGTYLDAAAGYIQDEEYEAAIAAYQDVLDLDSENTDAAEGIEIATNAQRDRLLKTVREYVAQGEFDLAEVELQFALENRFQNDEVLEKELASIQEQRINQMSEDIYTAAEGGDWDGAVELLDSYQKQFPDEQKLTDIRADIEEKMPITLKNLTRVSSREMDVLNGVVTDRYGNVYDGAVEFHAGNQGYALYNLSKKFTSFTGTAFVVKNGNTGYDLSFAIYVDEELVYYMDSISEETAPISFNIDVTNGTTLRITTDYNSYKSYSYLMFADTSFTKAGNSTTDAEADTAADPAAEEAAAEPEQTPTSA